MQINKICFNPKIPVKTAITIKDAKRNQNGLAANTVFIPNLNKTVNFSTDKGCFKGKPVLERVLNTEILRLMHIMSSRLPLSNEAVRKPFSKNTTGIIDLIDVVSTALSFINEGYLEKFDVFRPLKLAAEAADFSNPACSDILKFLKDYLKHENKIIRDNAVNCFMAVAINSGKELPEVINIINAQMAQNGSSTHGIANIKSLLKNADKFGKVNLPEIYNKTWDILQAGLEDRSRHEKGLIYGVLNEHPLNFCAWGFWLM